MKTKFLSILFLTFAIIIIQSCTDDIERTVNNYTQEEFAILSESLNIPTDVFDYTPDKPGVFENVNNSGFFDIKDERENHLATLGRVLFYDTKLSLNNSVSCGSCHLQSLAFADDKSLSEGFDGELSLRNSLPLGNTIGFEEAYGGGSFSSSRAQFGWDEANISISSQSRAAITSNLEMGMHNMKEVKDKLSSINYYPILFNKAFDNKNVTEKGILDALDAFVNSISSTNSKFDKAAKQSGGHISELTTPFAEFTANENAGKTLYNNNCASCHSFDHNKTSIAIANNGLDLVYEDKGVGARTGHKSKNGVFKVPFLRNIELTGPYMHDGRFATLEEVVDFYSENIADHDNLHFSLKQNNKAKKFNFTKYQKESLVAYLKTLTDDKLLEDEKWSDPF